MKKNIFTFILYFLSVATITLINSCNKNDPYEIITPGEFVHFIGAKSQSYILDVNPAPKYQIKVGTTDVASGERTVTNRKSTPPQNSRPMGLQECDKEVNLWFIRSKESRKNIQIENDNKVQLYFMNSSDYEYLSITGEAFIYDDKATIENKWSEVANAWFDGKDDPDVSIIRVSPSEVYYWDTKYGKFVSMVTFFAAIVTGKKTDNSDGVEGKIKIHT